MSLWLSDEELTELTGYKRNTVRYKALAEMSVKFIRRAADGYPLVERAQFEGQAKPRRRTEPNWEAAGLPTHRPTRSIK